MVANAPTFADLAEQLFDLLDDCVFVAHNARFDYSFIKNHFARAGINFQSKVLCTVRLSRKLFPQYKSHSLDRLIEIHDLQPLSRHRAMGDADLIKQFLTKCFAEFGEAVVIDLTKELTKQSALPSELETDLKNIPNTPGVYLFYNETDKLPIYIGKSINLRTRVMSHFTADYKSTREMNMKNQVKHIEYRETAGELGALLLESKLIKEKLPIYNRQLRRNKLTCGFVPEKNTQGYLTIKLQSISHQNEKHLLEIYGNFRSKKHAIEHLEDLITAQRLCPKLCGLDHSKKACFAYQLKACKGACCEQEPSLTYNLRVEMALVKYKTAAWPYPGIIAVKEHCQVNNLIEVHLFKNWRHLTTLKDPADLDLIDISRIATTPHNTDEAKIIQKFLTTKVKQHQIIEIKQSVFED